MGAVERAFEEIGARGRGLGDRLHGGGDGSLASQIEVRRAGNEEDRYIFHEAGMELGELEPLVTTATEGFKFMFKFRFK